MTHTMPLWKTEFIQNPKFDGNDWICLGHTKTTYSIRTCRTENEIYLLDVKQKRSWVIFLQICSESACETKLRIYDTRKKNSLQENYCKREKQPLHVQDEWVMEIHVRMRKWDLARAWSIQNHCNKESGCGSENQVINNQEPYCFNLRSSKTFFKNNFCICCHQHLGSGYIWNQQQ